MNQMKAVAAALGMAVLGSSCALVKDVLGITEREQQESQRKKYEAEREERFKKEDAEQAEREALAKTMKTLKVAELGISLEVPGDVEVEPHSSDAYGSPAMLLTGKASKFSVIVTNATNDRYDFAEHLARHRSEFRYGIDVIRQNQGAGGVFEFEYSYLTYFTDGTSAGRQMGYFARKIVSGKKVNCLIAGVGDKVLSRVIEACNTVAAAK